MVKDGAAVDWKYSIFSLSLKKYVRVKEKEGNMKNKMQMQYK